MVLKEIEQSSTAQRWIRVRRKQFGNLSGKRM